MDEPDLPRDATWPTLKDPADKVLPASEPKRPSLQELSRVHLDAEALELRRRHYSYAQIAKSLKLHNSTAAKEAADRAAERLRVLHEDDEAGIALELSRYDELSRILWQMLDHKHYVISNSGRIIEDPETGKPLIDLGPTLQTVDRLVTISRERRRIQALDRPVTTRVELRTVDAMDSEIERLLGLFADATRTERHQIAASIADPDAEHITNVEQITDAEVIDDPAQQGRE